MSMLAESKRKEKWCLNPRGKSWSSDKNKFGQRLLEKMGWSEGQGLGANNQGLTEIVKVRKKDDIKGLGFKENGEEWLKTTSEFNELLDQLGSSQEENTDDQTNQTSSLEDRSKKSKARVHYQKFTRGKDLSRYSDKDLASIIGPEIVKPKSSEEKKSNYSSNQVNKGSSADYFSKKKHSQKNPTQMESTQEDENLENNKSFEPPKKKKSKKTRNQDNDIFYAETLNPEIKENLPELRKEITANDSSNKQKSNQQKGNKLKDSGSKTSKELENQQNQVNDKDSVNNDKKKKKKDNLDAKGGKDPAEVGEQNDSSEQLEHFEIEENQDFGKKTPSNKVKKRKIKMSLQDNQIKENCYGELLSTLKEQEMETSFETPSAENDNLVTETKKKKKRTKGGIEINEENDFSNKGKAGHNVDADAKVRFDHLGLSKKKNKGSAPKGDSFENDYKEGNESSNYVLKDNEKKVQDSSTVVNETKSKKRKRLVENDLCSISKESSDTNNESVENTNPEPAKKKKKKTQMQNINCDQEHKDGSASVKKNQMCTSEELQTPLEEDKTPGITSHKVQKNEKQKKSYAENETQENNQANHSKLSSKLLEVLGRKTRLKQINNPNKGLSQTDYKTSEFMSFSSDSHSVSQSSNLKEKNDTSNAIKPPSPKMASNKKDNGDVWIHKDENTTVHDIPKSVVVKEYRLLCRKFTELGMKIPKVTEANSLSLPKTTRKKMHTWNKSREMKRLLPKSHLEEVEESVKAISETVQERVEKMNVVSQLIIQASELKFEAAVRENSLETLDQMLKQLEMLATSNRIARPSKVVQSKIQQFDEEEEKEETNKFETRLAKEITLLKKKLNWWRIKHQTKQINFSKILQDKPKEISKEGNSSVKGKQTTINRSRINKSNSDNSSQGTFNQNEGNFGVQGTLDQNKSNFERRRTFNQNEGNFGMHGTFNQNESNFCRQRTFNQGEGYLSRQGTFNQGFSQRGRGGFTNTSRGVRGISRGQMPWRNQHHFEEQEVSQGMLENQQSFHGSYHQQSSRGSYHQQTFQGSYHQQRSRGSSHQQSFHGSYHQQSFRGSYQQQGLRGHHTAPTRGWGFLHSYELPEHARFHGSHRGNFRGRGRGMMDRGGPRFRGRISQNNFDAKKYAEKCKAENKVPELVFNGVDLKQISGYASENLKEKKES